MKTIKAIKTPMRTSGRHPVGSRAVMAVKTMKKEKPLSGCQRRKDANLEVGSEPELLAHWGPNPRQQMVDSWSQRPPPMRAMKAMRARKAMKAMKAK